MNRSEILTTAAECVNHDRAATYGPAENSFGLIASYWSAHLGAPVTAVDVAAMMALLKLARIKGNPGHADSYVDLAGYAACGGEIATAKPPVVVEPFKMCPQCHVTFQEPHICAKPSDCKSCRYQHTSEFEAPCKSCGDYYSKWVKA